VRNFTHRLSAALSLVALASQVAACAPDLGACDAVLARQPAFVALPNRGNELLPDVRGFGGQPMFEGQALLATRCANGECHSSSADVAAGERHGVPAGFDLDVSVACDARAPAAACPPLAVTALRAARNTAYDYRVEIYDSVRGAAMPPSGPEADRLKRAAPTFVRVDGSPLPDIEDPEGQAILRNWLACRAPVIERAEDTAGGVVGEYCGDGVTGDCVLGPRKQIPAPEQNWDSIFALVIEPLCSSCHGPGTCPEEDRPCRTDFREESQLDLSTADLAYDGLVGVVARGAYCKNRGLTHIVPGNPDASFLLAKLAETPECGGQMPQSGQALPEMVLRPLREWIRAGAVR